MPGRSNWTDARGSSLSAHFSAGQKLEPYTVRAINDAADSENKIHDDAVAREYGYRGGLVPGVTVHAYMTHPIVEALGIAWLERGRMTARFLKPVYEGEETTTHARVLECSASSITVELSATDPRDETCAVGTASLDLADEPARVDILPTRQLPGVRPPADEHSLAVGTVLGTLVETFRQEPGHTDYLRLINEDAAVYHGSGAVAHPGWLMRRANSVLVENVRMGPWMHVSSDVTHLGLLHDGERLETRAVVTDLFERKGHRFVDLDVLMLANVSRPVMRVAHRAIYAIRKAGD